MNAVSVLGQQPVDGAHHPEAGPQDRHDDRPLATRAARRRPERRAHPVVDDLEVAARLVDQHPGEAVHGLAERGPVGGARRGAGPAARRRGDDRRRDGHGRASWQPWIAPTLASYLDHTLLRPEATGRRGRRRCAPRPTSSASPPSASRRPGCRSRPGLLDAGDRRGDGVRVPLGRPPLVGQGRRGPARRSTDGATEVDVVHRPRAGPRRRLGRPSTASRRGPRRAIEDAALLKVIIESAALDHDGDRRRLPGGRGRRRRLREDLHRASTPAAAPRVEAVALMAETVGGRLGVKASGGIRTAERRPGHDRGRRHPAGVLGLRERSSTACRSLAPRPCATPTPPSRSAGHPRCSCTTTSTAGSGPPPCSSSPRERLRRAPHHRCRRARPLVHQPAPPGATWCSTSRASPTPSASCRPPRRIERVAAECAEDLADDGVVYAEVRFAPEQHLEGGLTLDEVVEAAARRVRGPARTGGPSRRGCILSAMRTAANSAEIAELVLRHRDAGVVGFDIAGSESGSPPSRHLDAFRPHRRGQPPHHHPCR